MTNRIMMIESSAAPRGARRGSSLVEMLIAILVLGLVLISMLGMFVISRASIYTKEDETANALALRYMEMVEADRYENFNTPAYPWTPIKDNLNGKYTITAAIEDPKDDKYKVTAVVTVKWTPVAMGGSKQVALRRVISAGGHKNVGGIN